MRQAERDELKDKLNDFSRRLDAHVRDLKERGEFTDVHRRLIEDITQRHDQIRKKVALAENRGTPWDVIKSQTERDFSSIFDDLLQIGEKLDSDEMKRRYPNVTRPQRNL
jgi:precorrin-6B methylase 1